MMATRGDRPRPARRAATARKTFDTHHVAGLQQPFATPLDEIDASHYSHCRRRSMRLRGPGSQHYVAGIDGVLAPFSRSLMRVSQPVVVRCVETAWYPLRTRPLGEASITSFIACPTRPRNSPARTQAVRCRLLIPRTLW